MNDSFQVGDEVVWTHPPTKFNCTGGITHNVATDDHFFIGNGPTGGYVSLCWKKGDKLMFGPVPVSCFTKVEGKPKTRIQTAILKLEALVHEIGTKNFRQDFSPSGLQALVSEALHYLKLEDTEQRMVQEKASPRSTSKIIRKWAIAYRPEGKDIGVYINTVSPTIGLRLGLQGTLARYDTLQQAQAILHEWLQPSHWWVIVPIWKDENEPGGEWKIDAGLEDSPKPEEKWLIFHPKRPLNEHARFLHYRGNCAWTTLIQEAKRFDSKKEAEEHHKRCGFNKDYCHPLCVKIKDHKVYAVETTDENNKEFRTFIPLTKGVFQWDEYNKDPKPEKTAEVKDAEVQELLETVLWDVWCKNQLSVGVEGVPLREFGITGFLPVIGKQVLLEWAVGRTYTRIPCTTHKQSFVLVDKVMIQEIQPVNGGWRVIFTVAKPGDRLLALLNEGL